MSQSIRDTFAAKALEDIPKILTLMDRNRHSPTYGCFDRSYWHYKIIDFPSGMAQECVYPLALCYALDMPGNDYYQNTAVKQWVEAGIRFAACSAHADGSCDDYFPFEKALGAAAFTLLAFVESMELLDIRDADLLEFVQRRADWLADREESGRLSNHQALVALGLTKAGALLGTGRYEQAVRRRIEQLLSWQDPEGWFPEYDGCDPGYQTLTIAMLAELDMLRPEMGIRDPLNRSIDFTLNFLHPDGTFGGEYCSRNTYNYFPHGFELAGQWHMGALDMNTAYGRALQNGLGVCYSDDHIISHHAVSYILAWRDFAPERPEPAARPQGRRWFPNSKLLIERRGGYELYMGLNKGGVFKLFKDGELIVSDTQLSLIERRGKKTRNSVAHLFDDYELELGEGAISISGSLGWAKHSLMSTIKLLILRTGMITVGRLAPDLVRKVLQRMLIVGKRDAPYQFRRTIGFDDGGVNVRDELICPDWAPVEQVAIGPDQTSIYIAMSRTYQKSQLQDWLTLAGQDLPSQGQPLVIERSF